MPQKNAELVIKTNEKIANVFGESDNDQDKRCWTYIAHYTEQDNYQQKVIRGMPLTSN